VYLSSQQHSIGTNDTDVRRRLTVKTKDTSAEAITLKVTRQRPRLLYEGCSKSSRPDIVLFRIKLK